MTDMYIGQIIPFAGNFAIRGYAMCNGQLLSIQQNSALFAILGTTYGGNGQTNFALPNLQSRHMVHFGQGTGLSPYVLGQMSGVENVTLTTNSMPSHTHTLTGALNVSGLQPHATDPAAAPQSVLGHAVDTSSNANKAIPAIYIPSTGGATANVPLAGWAGTAANTGGSQPFTILSPSLAVNIQIVLQGIFPSRN